MTFKQFPSTRKLYIAALQQAILYNESFIDANSTKTSSSGISTKRTKQETIECMGGQEVYDEWIQETEDFGKQLRILKKRETPK